MFLAIVGVVSVAAAFGSAWVYMKARPAVTDQRIAAELTRLQAAAQVYRQRMHSYDGVCRDIGVRTGYECTETTEAYAVTAQRLNGDFYCVDSTGHFGAQLSPVRPNARCTKAQ